MEMPSSQGAFSSVDIWALSLQSILGDQLYTLHNPDTIVNNISCWHSGEMLQKLSTQEIKRVTSQPAIGPSVNAQEVAYSYIIAMNHESCLQKPVLSLFTYNGRLSKTWALNFLSISPLCQQLTLVACLYNYHLSIPNCHGYPTYLYLQYPSLRLHSSKQVLNILWPKHVKRLQLFNI